jgi:hypothetical protein
MIYGRDHETDVCDWRVVTIQLSVWNKIAEIIVGLLVLYKKMLLN